MKRETRTDKKTKGALELLDDAEKSHELLNDHLLSCSDDLTLLTLKGHLVIENLLDTILSRLLRIPNLPVDENAKLGFYQKLKLVESAVCNLEPGPNADIFCAITKLNSVRNKLAHNLKKPEEIEKDVKSLIDSYYAKAGGRPDYTKKLADHLRECLGKIWHFLIKVRLHFYKLEFDEPAGLID